jgi:hypothetical protein
MTARFAALWLAVLLFGCGAPVSPNRSMKPRTEALSPSDLLPNDLDFVVRIDLDRMRREPSLQGAARELANGGGSGMLRSILPSLERSRAIFVGGRVMADGFHGDGVIAIEPGPRLSDRDMGRVDGSFRPVAGGPADVEIFERATEARDEAARGSRARAGTRRHRARHGRRGGRRAAHRSNGARRRPVGSAGARARFVRGTAARGERDGGNCGEYEYE